MGSQLEASLQHDMNLIRQSVREMAEQCARALRGAMDALVHGKPQAAYLVILRDQRIDELEQQVDRLALEFMVRQQPAAGHLRFAYAALKISTELERIGDHAEGVARRVLKLHEIDPAIPAEPFSEMGEAALVMLQDAIKAFLEGDAELARSTMRAERAIDKMRQRIDKDLMRRQAAGEFGARGLRAAVHRQPPSRARGRRDPEHVRRDALHVHRRLREAQVARGVPHPVRGPAQPLPQPDGRGHRHHAGAPAADLQQCRPRPEPHRPAPAGVPDAEGARHHRAPPAQVTRPDPESRGLPRGGVVRHRRLRVDALPPHADGGVRLARGRPVSGAGHAGGEPPGVRGGLRLHPRAISRTWSRPSSARTSAHACPRTRPRPCLRAGCSARDRAWAACSSAARPRHRRCCSTAAPTR